MRGTFLATIGLLSVFLLPGCGSGDAGGTPYERGRSFMLRVGCRGCHVVEGAGGGKGPDLTHVATRLEKRLNGGEFEKEIEDRKTYNPEWYAKYRSQCDTVLAQKGDERIRAWLRVHLQDPRFNKPGTVMTSYGFFTDAERADLIEYLLTQK